MTRRPYLYDLLTLLLWLSTIPLWYAALFPFIPSGFTSVIHAFPLFLFVSWGKIMIPMYRLWLHGLYGLYGPHCPLSPERPLNLITHSLVPVTIIDMILDNNILSQRIVEHRSYMYYCNHSSVPFQIKEHIWTFMCLSTYSPRKCSKLRLQSCFNLISADFFVIKETIVIKLDFNELALWLCFVSDMHRLLAVPLWLGVPFPGSSGAILSVT